MRKLVYAINLTIDGCCDHTKFGPDEELMDYYVEFMREVGLLVYGRKTYELMVPYWPDIAKEKNDTRADVEFAQAFDAHERVVFSRLLGSVDDAKARIVRTGLKDEILKLKQETGKDIATGGVDVPSQLIELGLVDEFRFVVQPVIVGEGRRLFEGMNLGESLRLKLVESKTFKSGSVALRYLKQ